MTNQKDAIIAACKPILEFANDFVEHKVDKIYIHGYNRDDGYSCTFFYGVNEKIYSRNEILFVLDFPVEKKRKELKIFSHSMLQYWNKIWELFVKNDCDFPIKTKICYDVVKKAVEVDYYHVEEKYDLDTLESAEIWMNELKQICNQEFTERYLGYLKNRKPIKNRKKTDVEDSKWRQVFSSCLGKMIAIQLACGEHVVGEQDWEVNFQKGVIQFGNDEYPIQFLGSESREDETWLWGWENVNQFDEKLLKLVKTAKQQGEALGLESFGVAEVALNNSINGHNLATVVCGLQEPPLCYYRCPHSGGAAFVALTEVPQEVFAPVNLQKFADITMKCINYHKIDHKVFVESFLDWNKTAYHWDGNCIIAQFDQELQIGFEEIKSGWRIEKMEISSL